MDIIKYIFSIERSKKNQISALDGVRGMAVLFVLFSHVANKNILIFPNIKLAGAPPSGSGSGQIGVYLFFSLSAFLLTRGLIRLDNKILKKASSWRKYFIRRIFRIYPLYTVVLFSCWLAAIFRIPYFYNGYYFSGGRDILDRLMMQSAGAHFWTIPTEVKYYLFIPFVVLFFVCLNRNIITFIISILLFSITAQCYIYFNPPEARFSILRFLPIFFMGSLGAVLNERFSHLIKKKSVTTYIGFVCLAILFVCMPNVFILVTGVSVNLFHPQLGIAWGLLCGLLIIATINSNVINRFFSVKPFRFIGIISFSLYLWHPFILNGVERCGAAPILKILIFYSSTFIFCTISYIVFEKPFLNSSVANYIPIFFKSSRFFSRI